MKRIVITGMGAVTPVGIGTEEYWKNLTAGKSGIGAITRFDASKLPVRIAGEIKDFRPGEIMPRGMEKKAERFMQYAYVAAAEALAQSKLNTNANPGRVGIVMGSALNGVCATAEAQETLLATHKRVSPRLIPNILGNIAAANIAIANNIEGLSFTVSTACSSGGDAVNLACLNMLAGKADAMVVVGGENAICPLVIDSLASARALSRQNESPQTASRPFDQSRDGFVIGEGGGALILETEEHALSRDAVILGEVCGCGNNNDAHHITAPHPEGRGAIACMKLALADAKLTPADIGYINAHGTATDKGDAIEVAAIREVFGDTLPPVSSTKGATGHMMGAGGITEIIACVKAIETGILPPTINLNAVDEPFAGVDFVPNQAKKKEITFAMSNAFGFGGQNSGVIVGKYKTNTN